MTRPAQLAVVGAGWAGLSAAVHSCQLGHHVSLFEMSHHLGGRARSLAAADGPVLDNGQHILIGAYRDTLALMRQVGVDVASCLHRQPLRITYPDGSGLKLPKGPALLALLRGLLGWHDIAWRDRVGFLVWAAKWQWRGFRCPDHWTVTELCSDCPPSVYSLLMEPLCVAALNTPAPQASAQVLLNVLHDALLGGAGSSDLLLPTRPLDELLPSAASTWLAQHGAQVRQGHRVHALSPAPAGGWLLDGQHFDQVILACSAAEAARLLTPTAPEWSQLARDMPYQPICTVWIQAPGVCWPEPMLAFHADTEAPAQFGFDLGQLHGQALAGWFSFVVSGAEQWLPMGQVTLGDLVNRQCAQAMSHWPAWAQAHPQVMAVRTEKRATFACHPALQRPAQQLGSGLWAAGDYIDGPYPATLEGAVRSGQTAARSASHAWNSSHG